MVGAGRPKVASVNGLPSRRPDTAARTIYRCHRLRAWLPFCAIDLTNASSRSRTNHLSALAITVRTAETRPQPRALCLKKTACISNDPSGCGRFSASLACHAADSAFDDDALNRHVRRPVGVKRRFEICAVLPASKAAEVELEACGPGPRPRPRERRSAFA